MGNGASKSKSEDTNSFLTQTPAPVKRLKRVETKGSQTKGTSTYQTGPGYDQNEVLNALEENMKGCEGNAEKGMVNSVKRVAGHIESIQKASKNFVQKAAEISKMVKSEEDRATCIEAIELAKTQRKLSIKTMNLCSKIATKGDSWRRFYVAMAFALQKLKDFDEQAAMQVLEKRATKNFPKVQSILQELGQIHPEWDELAEECNELGPKFDQIAERYDKMEKDNEETEKRSWDKFRWWVVLGAVAVAALVVLVVVACPVAGAAGTLAFGAAAATSTACAGGVIAAVSCAVVAGGAAVAAAAAANECSKTAAACREQGKLQGAVAAGCREIAEAVQNTSHNIKTNVMFFCEKMKSIIQHDIGSSAADFGDPEGDGVPTAKELCEALKFIVQTEKIDPDDEQDTMANLQKSIKACKELRKTVLALETSLSMLNADPEVSKSVRALYESSVKV